MGAGYGPNIVTDGLIFYTNARNRRSYSGSGTEWKDLSKNKFHGVLQNSPTWNYNSFILDGVDDKAEFPLVTSSRTNVTIQGWVYIQLNKKGTMFRMGGGANGYAIGQGGTNFDNTGNNLIVLFPNVRWAVTSYSFSTPGWYFVTLVLDGSSVPKVYVNNQYIGSYSGTIPAIPTANFYIGSTYGNSESTRYFNGQVSTCMVYNRELTIDEISQNYFATNNQYEKQILLNQNLKLYLDAAIISSYPGTGTTWTDLSGNYNGTLVNSPSFNLEGDGNLTFNGSNSYVSGGNTSVVNGNYTIDVWYKATGAPSTNDLYGGVLFCQSNNINYGIWLSHSYTNQTISHSSTLNSFITTGNGTALNNTIINAVGIWNGTTQSVYINGVLSTSRSYTSNPYAVSPLYQVGRWGYAGYERYFNGKIYSVKLYNRALTSDETLQNFNAVKSRYGL